jgi:esterase/lipase superfamily enzyme
VIVDRSVKPAPVFYKELAAYVQRSDRRDAFVFIHGYNVGFEDAIYRTAQMAYDLGFGGAPILFSWPSNGAVLEYTADVNNSDWSIDHLKTFLSEVAANSGATSVHLIGHSMGNRVLTGALERLAAEPVFAQVPRFTHLVLTAPDIDSGIFRQLATTIQKTAARVTLYASSNDRALQVSKRINGYPRAGESGASIVVLPICST